MKKLSFNDKLWDRQIMDELIEKVGKLSENHLWSADPHFMILHYLNEAREK
jgi:hypothetical protein